MRSIRAVMMVTALVAAGFAGGARADVKAGVDAWQAGDYAKAVGEWRKPAEGGDPDAQFNLAQAYKLGRGVPADLSTAQSWYYKAAAQGHEQAQANLGLILFQNGDRKGALPWIQKSADRGEPRAQYVLGTILFNGDLLPKDWVKAYALMTRASAAGLPQSRTSLAQMEQHLSDAQQQQAELLARDMARNAVSDPVEIAGAKPAAKPTSAKPAPAPKPAPVQTAQAPTAPKPEPVKAVPPVPKPEPAETTPPAAKPEPIKTTEAAAKPEPVKTAQAAPKPALAKSAAPKPAAAGKYRVQLGAYSSAASARAAWNSAKGGALKGLQPYIVQAGAVHRLQAGPFATRAAAEKACKASGRACFVVVS